MQRDPLLYGVIGFIIGGIFVGFLAANAVNTSNGGMMRMMGMSNHIDDMNKHHEDDHAQEAKEMMELSSMEGMMKSMRSSLDDKIGDDFDKAFLSEMIVHHVGAVDMAKEAQTNAKHDELKSMADDIVSTQTKEINQMKEWQKKWGYLQ
jgi:uncharacterized protein (DUF305 family)